MVDAQVDLNPHQVDAALFAFNSPLSKGALLADEVGLGKTTERQAGKLSLGEQRALELAMALATRPKLLLLDEPMAGTGPEESARMVELIEHLARHVTILLVEHDMAAVFRLADRVSVLVGGQMIFTGTPDAARNDPGVRRAYLGDTL